MRESKRVRVKESKSKEIICRKIGIGSYPYKWKTDIRN